ncbi:MAG: cation:proton antiporter [Alphaproteobacteria bacterium]|nr:cation:proton antiporter [Alphaproteobacteria bacterium]
MEEFLITIDYRDPAWIAVAFLSGLLVRQINLPPMVGFLAAGFVLNLLGAENDRFLLAVADMGVTLLLFTIGLKLRLDTLIRPEIWATTALHMTATICLGVATVLSLGWAGVLLFGDLDPRSALILAFALSFSSTVFVVKILEDRGAVMARYGQVAIGILVMQDIAAVAFVAMSAGKLPSPWAIALILLIPARPLLGFVMRLSGRRELLAVFGFSVALGGAALFELVGMKGDLGALIVGVLLAPYAPAKRLADLLMNFKDVFLVCFFLTIGLTGLPTWELAATALVLVLLVPIKAVLFTLLLLRFRMRSWGAVMSGLALSNESEFGLIVAVIAVSAGWFPPEWLTVVALALAASFLFSAFINLYTNRLYTRLGPYFRRFEQPERLRGDEDIDLAGQRIMVFGMGRVGRAAYDEMRAHAEDRIIGIDLDEVQVSRNRAEGRSVVLGDATNPEFWLRLITPHEEIVMILLAMPHHNANLEAAKRLRTMGYEGPIVATALYPDQEPDLRANGVNQVFNIYAAAGGGAAAHMHDLLGKRQA